MKNVLEYNGYTGIVEFSADDKVFFGKIFGIDDLITFEAETVRDLEKAFRVAVDDYIKTCFSEGKQPERAYKGSFNVRIKPELHRMAAVKAQTMRVSLNELVELAITREVLSGAAIVAETEPEYPVRKSKADKGLSKKRPKPGQRSVARRTSEGSKPSRGKKL